MRSTVFVFFAFIIVVTSCDKNRVFDNYQPVKYAKWHKDSVMNFKLDGIDSLQSYNLFINLRNNNNFKYNNLFLITEIRFPQGKVITDTLEYQMATPDGEWLGKGFGDIKENKLWYKENVSFNEPGDYEVRIKQAMRKNGEVEGLEELEGITHVGFRIEKNTDQE